MQDKQPQDRANRKLREQRHKTLVAGAKLNRLFSTPDGKLAWEMLMAHENRRIEPVPGNEQALIFAAGQRDVAQQFKALRDAAIVSGASPDEPTDVSETSTEGGD